MKGAGLHEQRKQAKRRGSKRGNGEGTVCERSDGRWQGSLRLPNGQRKHVYGKTQRECRENLQNVRDQIRRGLPLAPERLTLAAHLQHWIEAVVRPNRRRSTYIGYEVNVRLHIVPHLGAYRLTQLQPHHVEEWLSTLRESSLSPRTVQYAHAVLRAGLEHALRQDLIARNVAKLVEGVRVERADVQPLEPEQVHALLKAAEGDRLEALYVLAVYSGLRRGELLGLEWNALDLDAEEMRVNVQAQHGRTGEHLKRRSGRRTVPLAPVAVEALHRHRVRQIEEQLLAGQRWQDHGLVFPSRVGTPLNTANLWRYTAKLLEHAGIPHHKMHLYRHTFASLHLAEGAELHEVPKLLGHSSLQITSDIYGHMTRQSRCVAVDRIQRALERSS